MTHFLGSWWAVVQLICKVEEVDFGLRVVYLVHWAVVFALIEHDYIIEAGMGPFGAEVRSLFAFFAVFNKLPQLATVREFDPHLLLLVVALTIHIPATFLAPRVSQRRRRLLNLLSVHVLSRNQRKSSLLWRRLLRLFPSLACTSFHISSIICALVFVRFGG